MRLTLVVPATDEPPTLEPCLQAVRAAAESPEDVVVVRLPHGSGPAAARNAGAGDARGDVVVFLDADVLVHEDAFARIREAFARDRELVAVFGSYDDEVLTRGVVAGFRNLLHHVVHQRSAGEVSSFWAGLGAIRMDAFRAVGGFDADRYPEPSIEDVELGGRLAEHGRIVLDPDLQGTHLKEWTLRSMIATDFTRRGVPWVALMADHRAVPATLNLGVRERASVLAALLLVVALAIRRPGLASAALAAGVGLNADLYVKVERRLGITGVVAALPLHVLHQLVAVAAVPAGLAASLRRRGR
jgi:GT2 family glycosyltransferase